MLLFYRQRWNKILGGIKLKRRKFISIFLMILFTLTIGTTSVYASLFYDISGDTTISWTSTGVRIVAYTSTDEIVDFVQVYTNIWVDGTFKGSRIDANNDYDFAAISSDDSYYGFVYAETRHDALDWTGDEQIVTSDSYIR